ncbi:MULTISPECIES: hypothetical protein [unclassified Chryseobacterium]|uniref:hypothetical protein n=1 Tax=unclassified Chryseobacterium TaxID=2593645 RepID=UPI00100BECC9|nr:MULTISPECIES: hypothetical protein [unclassified Chryseobacterium]RXM49697.1 hypothetical protein BOQ64_22695 [Chryseobacterium sp. CH25]RXM61538.1 hypothetical protein BOQ60_23285 [Chryseobacterium sp. CH1]
MKKIISLLALLFCITLSIPLSAQTFTLEQFTAFNKLGMADFKKEMKNLNYRFYDKTEGLGFVLAEYEAPDYQSKIGKFEYKDQSDDRIEYEFKTKKEYEQYLKIIKEAGYKETEKGKIITKESYVDYYKNKEHIRLITPKAGENNPYTILVFK